MLNSVSVVAGLLILLSSLGASVAKAQAPNPCQDLLMAIAKLSTDVRMAELDRKTELETELAGTLSTNEIKHWGDVENSIGLERVMLYLDSGERDKLAALLKPKHREIVSRLREMGLLAQAMTEDPRSPELLRAYQKQSFEFGKIYDQYKAHLNLLISVAEGKGVRNLFGKIPKVRTQQAANHIVYDLTSPLAQETALMTLTVLDLFEGAFHAKGKNASVITKAKNFSRDIRLVFRSNLSTFNGVFQSRVDEINKRNTILLRVGKHVSYAYLKALSFSQVPDRYKKYAMMLAALSYDRLMLERYLGNIQEVTEITRGINDKGLVVNVNDPVLVDKQLRYLMDINASGLDDEMLVTFARFPHLKVVWANLMKMAQDKAKGTQDYTQAYVRLYERMQHAEKEAHTMGDLSYIFEAPLGRHMASVLVTGGYTVLTSEAVLKWVSDYHLWEIFDWASAGFPLK